MAAALSAADEARKQFSFFQQNGVFPKDRWSVLRDKVNQVFPQAKLQPVQQQSSTFSTIRQKLDQVMPILQHVGQQAQNFYQKNVTPVVKQVANQPLFQMPGVGFQPKIPSPTIRQAVNTVLPNFEQSTLGQTIKGNFNQVPQALKQDFARAKTAFDPSTEEGMQNMLFGVVGGIGGPIKTFAKKPIGLIRKSVKPTAEQISQSESQIFREAQAAMKASQSTSPYQQTFNKMRNFLRLAGEKRSKETGELFREHIPRNVLGQSSDELASSMGITENELMSKLTEGLNIGGTGLRKSRGFTNVRSIDNPMILGKDWRIRRNVDEGKRFVGEMMEEKRMLKDPRGIADSFDDLVNKAPVDVKKKVNFFDYLRTPNRVLDKIGLGEEAKLLRTKYDNYLSDLPKEIDKITAWSKRVHPSSNQRIFQWLDGDEIKLNNEELKVASEVKGYLKEWATKLKLPEEKQISNYITHIFEKGKITKEFDPELAKLIRGKVVKSVYDPFLQRRVGAPEYLQDTWGALDAYTKRAVRKFHMDQALEKVALKAENLPEESYNYVKGRIARINMQPTEIDNLIDNAIKSSPVGYRLGQRPVTATTQKARQMVFRGLLGLNPGTALRNLQQSTNSYAVLGEKHFGVGLMKTVQNLPKLLLNKETELEKAGVLGKDIIQDRTINAVGKFWQYADDTLFYLFNMAEKINRGIAYFGAKSKGLSQGMDEQKAIQYAKDVVGKTQFYYDVIDTPQALSSDLAKTLFQFAKYPLAQTEFLVEMIKNKNAAGSLRWIASNLLFVATAGKVLGLEYKDMFPQFRFGIPPTLQAPFEAGKAALNVPDQYGNVSDEQNPLERVLESKGVQRGALNYVPAGGQIRKTFEAGQAMQEGGSFTPTGKLRFEVKPELKNLLFGIWNTPEAKTYLDNLQGKNLSSEEQSAQEFKQQEKEVKDAETKLAGKLYIELKKLSPEEYYQALQQLDAEGKLTDSLLSKLKSIKNSEAKKDDSSFVKAVRLSSQTNFGKAKFINLYLQKRTPKEKYELLKELEETGILTDDLLGKVQEMQ